MTEKLTQSKQSLEELIVINNQLKRENTLLKKENSNAIHK